MNCDTSRVYSFSKGLPGTSSRLLTNLSCMFLSSSYASSGERSLSAQTQRIASMLLRASLFGCRKPRVSSAKSTKSSFFVSQPMVLSLSFFQSLSGMYSCTYGWFCDLVSAVVVASESM